jgi:transcriptional regulator with XRE-family HTH domain
LQNATQTERQVVIVVNTNKIKGRMKELEITQADVAKCLEIAQPTANQKINNVRPFDLNEAEKLAELLNIEAGDFGLYFFAQ